MSLDTRTINHICGTIRRQVQEEFPGLILSFVVYPEGKRAEAIDAGKSEILSYPSGRLGVALLEKHNDNTRTGFLGIIAGKRKSLISMLARPCVLGLFLLKADQFETKEQLREHLYHQAWHAIELAEHYMQQDKQYKIEDHVVLPIRTPLRLSRSNLMADAFAAMMMQVQSSEDVIRELAQRRVRACLDAIPGYQAEKYPYLIALETTQIVFSEARKSLSVKNRIVENVIQLTKEIGATHDNSSIKQWWDFSSRTQEMAWMGIESERILSAGLYTSEDPYVRSTAYLAMEALGEEPESFLDNNNIYNAFTDQEVNERLHNKMCHDSFERALDQALQENNPGYFMEEARQQNLRLQDTHIVGWCAFALINAATAFQKAEEGAENKTEAATKAFRDTLVEMPWGDIHKSVKPLIAQKRKGRKLDMKLLAALAERDKGFLPFAKSYKATVNDKVFVCKEAKQTKTAYSYAYKNPDNLSPLERMAVEAPLDSEDNNGTDTLH